MILTKECKEDFEIWFEDNPSIFTVGMIQDIIPLKMFYKLPYSMQYGVYVEFFNNVGIYPVIINEAYSDGVNTLWQVFEYDPGNYDNWSNRSSGLYGDNGDYTLDEARAASIAKSNELYNEG